MGDARSKAYGARVACDAVFFSVELSPLSRHIDFKGRDPALPAAQATGMSGMIAPWWRRRRRGSGFPLNGWEHNWRRR